MTKPSEMYRIFHEVMKKKIHKCTSCVCEEHCKKNSQKEVANHTLQSIDHME